MCLDTKHRRESTYRVCHTLYFIYHIQYMGQYMEQRQLCPPEGHPCLCAPGIKHRKGSTHSVSHTVCAIWNYNVCITGRSLCAPGHEALARCHNQYATYYACNMLYVALYVCTVCALYVYCMCTVCVHCMWHTKMSALQGGHRLRVWAWT
jgi:hypothetical protein